MPRSLPATLVVALCLGPAAASLLPAPSALAQGAKPRLVPPELLESAEATYPDEARAAGLEGKVVLRLSIDDQGKVLAAEVTAPAGHGFDEAAAAAARRFVFRPATRDGTPVAARILYTYTFSLGALAPPAGSGAPPAGSGAPPAAPGAPPAGSGASPAGSGAAVRPPPTVGILRGTLLIDDSVVGIEGVKVVLRGAGGQLVERVTDVSGAWQVEDATPGKWVIEVSIPGYDPIRQEEEVSLGQATEVRYRLRPVAQENEVRVRGERPDREVTRRSLGRNELTRLPGTGGDALRAVQNMPSVARTTGFDGLLIVRGSAPSGTQIFVDGSYIPVAYHFGGLSSVIPTEMLDAIDFYPGSFGVRYGRVDGGIIDIRTRTPAQDGQVHGLAQVDLIDARLFIEAPVPGQPGWSYAAGFRRSWVDAWVGPVLRAAGVDVTTAPVYYDGQFFVEGRPTPRSKLRVGVYGSSDQLRFVIDKPPADDPGVGGDLSSSEQFYRFQANYENRITDQLSVELMGSLGQNIEKQHVGQLRVDATYTVGAARGDITYKFGPAFSLRAGWDVVLAQYGADVRVPQPPGIGENPPLVTEKYFSLKTLGNISRPAGYVEAQITPTERLKITPGLRVDREMFDEQTDLGPRLNARLDLIKSPGRLTAKAGGGLFYQQNEFVNRFPTFGGGKLQSEKAIHASAGLEQELTSKIDLSVEGFYKDLSRIAVRQADTRLANVGSGEVIGLETLLRWKPGGRLFGWVAYTLSKATRVDLPGGATRLFEYDQTHNLTALLSVKLGRGWQVGGRFRLVSGSPYTPCTGGVFDASSGIYRCIEGAPYSARLPAFHQLDLRVDKQWDFESWRLGVYLDALNVYNHKNPEAVTYSFDQSRSTYSNGVPFFPSIGVRGEM